VGLYVGSVVGELTDRAARAAGPGRHGDGDGLFLVVAKSGRARNWVLRYQLKGARRDMGLGRFPDVGLAAARTFALRARGLISQGIDPLEARKEAKKAEKAVPRFADMAKIVIKDAQRKSTNEKVRYQWERHLGPAYCGPLLERPINEITTLEVAAVLRPVWRKKPEVARKLYPAIRRVFEYARIRLRDEHGIAMPDNPARWDDLKAMGYEAPAQLSRGRHPSLAYQQMPAFMAALRERDAIAARMLEFLILTNVRTGTALAATWDEFDLDAFVWTVPLVNLKDKKHRKQAFRVPLSARAVEILREMQSARVSRHVFPGFHGKALSNMAMLTLLKRMNSGDQKWLDALSGKPIVPHGFRASFRTWAEETAHFPHAVIEEAMGHIVGTQVERAYRRTDVLEQRRQLMDAWAIHCEPRETGNVVRFEKPGGRPA
jgi:integrase